MSWLVPSRTANAPNESEGSSWSLPIRPHPLCEQIVERVGLDLKPPLRDSCEWLEKNALEVGGGPLIRGDVAEVWVGRMGDRPVAIKSYRLRLPCSDYLPAYMVSGVYPRYAPSTENLSAEVPCRSTRMQSYQWPAHSTIYRSVLYPRAPNGARFRVSGS